MNFDGPLHSGDKGICLHMSEAADAREGYGITRRFSEPSQCGVGEAALAANWSSAVAGEAALAANWCSAVAGEAALAANWSSAVAGESTLGANGETSKIAKRIQRPMAWF